MIDERKELKAHSDYYSIKSIDELIPGDIVLHPIYREDGLMLMSAYTNLSPLLISQIKIHLGNDLPIMVVFSTEQLKNFLNNNLFSSRNFIQDMVDVVEVTKQNFKLPISMKSYIDEKVNTNLVNTYSNESYRNELFRRFFYSSPLWSSLETILESEKLQQRAKYMKKNIIDKVLGDEKLLDLINDMKDYDETLFRSGFNTLCISMLMGLTIEFSEQDLLNLCIAALVANAGYIKIDKEEYFRYLKSEEITDSIKAHIIHTIEVLSRCPDWRDKDIILGILDHHEYYNGKGFPAGKKGTEISLIGRILSIATTYEDLVGDYFPNSSMTSNSAINIIFENKEGKFDSQILNAFLHRSNVYKIGQPIFIPGEGRGTIKGFSNYVEAPHKPIVMFIKGNTKDYYRNI